MPSFVYKSKSVHLKNGTGKLIYYQIVSLPSEVTAISSTSLCKNLNNYVMMSNIVKGKKTKSISHQFMIYGYFSWFGVEYVLNR